MPPAAVTARLQELAARSCARGGVRVGVGELLAAHRALAAVDAGSREQRSTRCARRCAPRTPTTRRSRWRSRAVFARRGGAPPRPPLGEIDARGAAARRASRATTGPPSARSSSRPSPAAWSEEELLRTQDFAELHATPSAPPRGGCSRGSPRAGRRASAAARAPRGGAAPCPTCAPRRAPRCARAASCSSAAGARPPERPRRLVLVLDVSGSMAPYARMLLQYVQACVAARARVEAFAFGTRLTRLTRELAGRDPDRALRAGRRPRDGLVGRHADRRLARRRSTASTAAGSGAARSS